MIEVLFSNGVGAFEYDVTNAIDSISGAPEKEWEESRFMKIAGEYHLESSTTLEEGLHAACMIMQANLLGFRALSNECRRNHELYF